jgi:hypothetical protein
VLGEYLLLLHLLRDVIVGRRQWRGGSRRSSHLSR